MSVASAISAALAAAKAERNIIIEQLSLGIVSSAYNAPSIYHAIRKTGMETVAINIPPSWPWGMKGSKSEIRCQDRCSALRAELDIKMSLNTESLVWHGDVDAVIITAPVWHRKKACIRALTAGKHVSLCVCVCVVV